MGNGFDFEKIANNIPLVTVISAKWFFSKELFPQDKPLPIDPPGLGITWPGKSDATRVIEEECELDIPDEPQRYFFAGRADQNFGRLGGSGEFRGLVFAYNPSIEGSHTGSATPFDTGDLWNRVIAPKLVHESDVKKLIRKTTVPLEQWRKSFKGFLKAFFPNPRDYYDGRPRADADWEGPNNLPARDEKNAHFHAWTWEVRLHEEHPLLEGLLLWAAPRETHTELESYGSQPDLSSYWGDGPSWVERLQEAKHIDLGPIPDIQDLKVFEDEIQKQLF
uniref:Uncharacterized protein n=1 Tax=Candidatus Kentrum sp. MB TaxID=2138164 RepID=A0A450XKQ9_9GAMM|nr:MAG: hypothetical protein BECKMB1821G_GA0114241_10553 [Candidatus Kentron sp. MB]VFK33897.1 MAG: hypothetical protein BECKMB1821I_GA0114274_10563 [Candidatus Kentron sp. MB]VFK76501.1 MAG: hypothetical protein BECKMB1821H_GA0114242_10603 [Candidatus Kentron sp. MB]